MIIETTLGDLDETLNKYSDMFGPVESYEIELDDENMIGVDNYRIQIPTLGITLRSGLRMSLSGMDNDAKVWMADASLTVIYDIDHESPEDYIGWSADSFDVAVYKFLNYIGKEVDAFMGAQCFLETSDVMNEEEAASLVREIDREYEGTTYEYICKTRDSGHSLN